jgi:hypothetical protein
MRVKSNYSFYFILSVYNHVKQAIFSFFCIKCWEFQPLSKINLLWQFVLSLEPSFASASKSTTFLKSYQKWHKNNHLSMTMRIKSVDFFVKCLGQDDTRSKYLSRWENIGEIWDKCMTLTCQWPCYFHPGL